MSIEMLCEMKDPAIKLFGKTIPIKETQIPSTTLSVEKSDQDCQSLTVDSEVKNGCREETKEQADAPVAQDCGKPESSSTCNLGKEDNHQTPISDNKGFFPINPEGNQPETDTASQEKVLKKPDKIIPCPRCNSLDTKFCYYNNYNVSQPRHFCKNCQRYWTAGGTMRNVPVGAGRRKNKHLNPCRQLMMASGVISASQVDMTDVANHQGTSCIGVSAPSRPMKGSQMPQKFGPDMPLFESMENSLNLCEHKKDTEMGSLVCIDDGEEPSSCGSSVTASSCRVNEFPGNVTRIEQGGMPGSCNELTPTTHPMQFYPGPPWPYPWNSGWNNVVPVTVVGHCSPDMVYGQENGNSIPAQWGPTSMVAAPVFCPQTIAFPFVPPPTYWSCMPTWSGGAFNVPWAGPTSSSIPQTSSTSNSGCSSNCSPTLGKHSRDAKPLGEEKSENFLWVPKTLRIDDPDEAAKSSIWATLGIKPDRNEPITGGGIFKAFQPKTEGKGHTLDAAQVLRANPAAFSRSQSFQENT